MTIRLQIPNSTKSVLVRLSVKPTKNQIEFLSDDGEPVPVPNGIISTDFMDAKLSPTEEGFWVCSWHGWPKLWYRDRILLEVAPYQIWEIYVNEADRV